MNLGTKCFENENEIVLSVGVLENNIITINKQVKNQEFINLIREMVSGKVVDVDKSIEIEILKEEAQITDVVIKNISNEQEKISLEYNLNDIDETIDKAMLYLYNEENIIIQQEELEKNNKSNIQLDIN